MTSSHPPSGLSWVKAGWWQHCILGWKKGEEKREVGLLELKWPLESTWCARRTEGLFFTENSQEASELEPLQEMHMSELSQAGSLKYFCHLF